MLQVRDVLSPVKLAIQTRGSTPDVELADRSKRRASSGKYYSRTDLGPAPLRDLLWFQGRSAPSLTLVVM